MNRNLFSSRKIPFLKRMLRHRLAGRQPVCPFCGESTKLATIARKKLVLDILQCSSCLLIFRWPMETPEEFQAFYQQEYTEGAITDLPTAEDLRGMCDSGFPGPLDHSGKIELLRALIPSARVLDYGCSWGYGLFQLRRQGFEGIGFEVSAPRALFARSWLGDEILERPAEIESLAKQSFDVIFSNHVVEHLPQLHDVFATFARLLRPAGLLFAVLPNFNGREARNGRFLNWIGEAHPIAPTREFFLRNLPAHGFRDVHCPSGPFSAAATDLARQGRFEKMETEGDELMVLAWKS